MRRLMLVVSTAVLFVITSFTLAAWGQAEPATSSPPEKPAARATHHKAHPAERHAAHQAERHTAHPAERHAPHEAERHPQRHGKRHHRRHTGA
jgi:hypothetical protein